MSRYMGSITEGQPPPHVPKTKSGSSFRPNKYANAKPSEQKNTSGQRRVRRADEMLARRIEEGE